MAGHLCDFKEEPSDVECYTACWSEGRACYKCDAKCYRAGWKKPRVGADNARRVARNLARLFKPAES